MPKVENEQDVDSQGNQFLSCESNGAEDAQQDGEETKECIEDDADDEWED